jgi:hypothetical protein
MQVKSGDIVWWTSPQGFSARGGERAEVYETRGDRAAINTAGDVQNPEGYSYSVHMDELSPMPVRTFAEFQATGRDVADLGTIDHIAASGIESGAGRVYFDGYLFIQLIGTSWEVPIGNTSERFTVLTNAERKLYEFALSEGYINAESIRQAHHLSSVSAPHGADSGARR